MFFLQQEEIPSINQNSLIKKKINFFPNKEKYLQNNRILSSRK